MYEQFFGLSRPPFKITPDTSLFYDGGRRGDVLAALVYAVQRGEGIVKVVGEVGSGKTMLCRMLQQELPKTVEIIYIANPSVSADDILFVIAHELSLNVAKDSSKHEVMNLLQAHLLKRFMAREQVVLFIEEAQGMPLETLEEIRLLSNLETEQDKLLQIILFGQPELDENLKTPSIRQLKERVTHEFNLTPLTAEEVYQYLNFRMREVGYTGPELIDADVAKVITKYSGGLLRRINIIADKVLLAAFADSTHNVDVRHVNAAVKDSGFERSINGELTDSKKGFLVSLLVLIALFLWLFFSGQGLALFNMLNQSSQSVKPLLNEPVVIDAPKKVLPLVSVAPVSELTAENEVVEKQDDKIEIIDAQGQKTSSLDAVIAENIDNLGIEKSANKDARHKAVKNTVKSLTKLEEIIKINKDAVTDNEVKAINENVSGLKDSDWLISTLKSSKDWLSVQSNKGVSIQVMVAAKDSSENLVNDLRRLWPSDLANIHLYEVVENGYRVYKVFYGAYSSLEEGRNDLKELPEEVTSNGPYLHSIYKMKQTLL